MIEPSTIIVSDIPVSYVQTDNKECKSCERITNVVQATLQIGNQRIDFCNKFCLQQYLMHLRQRGGIKN